MTEKEATNTGPSEPVDYARPIQPEVFASWEDFKSNFCEHLFPGKPFRRGKYLFRGHSNSDWKLETTFDRMFKNQSKARRLEIADELLDLFKRGLEGEEIPAEVRNNDSLFLALGQHYGLPTRLLDWTESPYIAAFFAYNSRALWGAKEESTIAIWVLDTSNPIWSSQFGVEIVDIRGFGNKRYRNQSGKFTLSKTIPDLESYAVEHADEGQPLRKFLLPARDYTKALADLDAMGIHHGTVYPEIEGAAQMALSRIVLGFETFAQSRTSRPA